LEIQCLEIAALGGGFGGGDGGGFGGGDGDGGGFGGGALETDPPRSPGLHRFLRHKSGRSTLQFALDSIDLADAEFGLAQIIFFLRIAQGDAGEKAVEGNFSGIVVLTQYLVPVSLDQ
jgi:hypothetical protein